MAVAYYGVNHISAVNIESYINYNWSTLICSIQSTSLSSWFKPNTHCRTFWLYNDMYSSQPWSVQQTSTNRQGEKGEGEESKTINSDIKFQQYSSSSKEPHYSWILIEVPTDTDVLPKHKIIFK